MSVVHQENRRRFVVQGEDDEAVLEYVFPEKDRVDFVRTFVPESLRGKGLAGQLADAGLAWAREKGLRIEASCSYMRKRLESEGG